MKCPAPNHAICRQRYTELLHREREASTVLHQTKTQLAALHAAHNIAQLRGFARVTVHTGLTAATANEVVAILSNSGKRYEVEVHSASNANVVELVPEP